MTIWKFPVEMTDRFQLSMPGGAEVLSVQTQDGNPQLWAICDPGKPIEMRTFRVIGTGHPIDDWAELAFVGTFQLHGGGLVFHLFELSHAA